jgi:hypothetical protein
MASLWWRYCGCIKQYENYTRTRVHWTFTHRFWFAFHLQTKAIAVCNNLCNFSVSLSQYTNHKNRIIFNLDKKKHPVWLSLGFPLCRPGEQTDHLLRRYWRTPALRSWVHWWKKNPGYRPNRPYVKLDFLDIQKSINENNQWHVFFFIDICSNRRNLP